MLAHPCSINQVRHPILSTDVDLYTYSVYSSVGLLTFITLGLALAQLSPPIYSKYCVCVNLFTIFRMNYAQYMSIL